jgi:hypothetical protein
MYSREVHVKDVVLASSFLCHVINTYNKKNCCAGQKSAFARSFQFVKCH